GFAAVRDARYLSWRYLDCPSIAYTALRAVERGTGRTGGIAVLRFGWFDEPIAPIVEWLVPARDRAVAGRLLAACHDLAREHGCRSVKTWIPASAAAHETVASFGYERNATPFLLTTLRDQDRARAQAMQSSWYYTM